MHTVTGTVLGILPEDGVQQLVTVRLETFAHAKLSANGKTSEPRNGERDSG